MSWRAALARLPRGVAQWFMLAWWYAAVPIIIFYSTLLPRLQLARSLDLVTDESVYIPAGAIEVALLRAHNFTNPWWLFNHEAPALPKIIIGLGTLYGAQHDGTLGWLYGARAPAAWLSAGSFVLFFFLVAPIVGKRASALASMALALSPWLAFFGALAYLDTYLLCFMTLAIPLIWYAARHPWLYPLVGLFAGLAFASKYTAAAVAVPFVLYLFYYYRYVARRRPPWLHMALAPIVALLTIYITDPQIWLKPLPRLYNSILYQFDHASNGHDVFWNGAVWEHVPAGIGLFILVAKLSLFLTVPTAVALVWASARLIRRWRAHVEPTALDDRWVFALAWLVGLLVPFGALPIVVGTHYMLPLAPPTAIVASWGLIIAADWLAARWADVLAGWVSDWKAIQALSKARIGAWASALARLLGVAQTTPARRARLAVMGALTVVIAVALIAPPAHGLATTYQAEGYTAEWLNGENSTLQVAYPGYNDAVNWIVAHSQGRTVVTLIGTRGTLDFWRDTHRYDVYPDRIRQVFAEPTATLNGFQTGYIVWPEHLVQRQFPKPANFNSLIVHRVQGGATTYCLILKWTAPAT